MDKRKLLIADDSELNRAILANMLEQDYDIIEVTGGEETLAALQTYRGEISALLLDIVMPGMGGFEVLEEMRSRHWLDDVPTIMISAETGNAYIDRAFSLGASDYISRPFAPVVVRHRIINTILLHTKKQQLMEKLSAGTGGLVSGGAHMLIDLSSWYKTSLPPKIELIQSAIEQHRAIRFTYFSPKGESVRTVEPCYLVFHWSAWYVWGWCRSREDFRLFKLNRMTDLTAGEAFAPRPAPLPDLAPERIFPAKYHVTVLFHPSCRWRLVEEYGVDRFTEEPDGRLRFTGPFPDADSVVSWVLTFGDRAELVEPEELRDRLGELAEALARRYRKGD